MPFAKVDNLVLPVIVTASKIRGRRIKSAAALDNPEISASPI
jgi:hypothetical protein